MLEFVAFGIVGGIAMGLGIATFADCCATGRHLPHPAILFGRLRRHWSVVIDILSDNG
jgi:hypothetical protein